jgi:hypothetical protein
MVGVMQDNLVYWYEALTMVLCYFVYLFIMAKNQVLVSWFCGGEGKGKVTPSTDADNRAAQAHAAEEVRKSIVKRKASLTTTAVEVIKINSPPKGTDRISSRKTRKVSLTSQLTVKSIKGFFSPSPPEASAAPEERPKNVIQVMPSINTVVTPADSAPDTEPADDDGDGDDSDAPKGVLGYILSALSLPYYVLFKLTGLDVQI